MRTSGKIFRFVIVVICVGFIAFLIPEGKFSSIWNNIQELVPGKKEHKLTFKDYEFKLATRRDVFQKVLVFVMMRSTLMILKPQKQYKSTF